MKRHLSLILIGLGMLVLISGFVYDLMFAGIPYQDPTPEMSARYDFHARVASIFYLLGSGAFLIGTVIGVVRVVRRRCSKPQSANIV